MFGLGIIAAVVVFGGVLALLGDRVGMKVGKKRLTIFGLRPKYTSMIITVLTGFFIAGLTLMILTLMSDYVRKALFELRTIEQNLQATTAKVIALTREIHRKEDEFKALTIKNEELHQNLNAVIAERGRVEEQLSEAHQQYLEASKTLVSVRSNLSSTKEELDLAQNRLNNLSRINEDLKTQMTNLTLQESRLTQQIQNLEGWLKNLEERNQAFVDNPIIFYVGEILVAKIIPPGIHSDQAFAEVVEPLLKSANEAALKRGARIPGKSDYAVRVAPQRVAEVSSQITASKVQTVVRVVVEKNSVLGEPVTVTLESYPNQTIFKAGEAITETILSSEASESELRDQLLSLLILANNKAIENGIITEGQNLRNVISISEIAGAIQTVRAGKGKVKVGIVAIDNISRVDPFKIKFALKTLEG